MSITAERIDHAITRLRATGSDGAKVAHLLEQKAEQHPRCDAHPTELPSILTGVHPDGFNIVCASCIPHEARDAVTFVGHDAEQAGCGGSDRRSRPVAGQAAWACCACFRPWVHVPRSRLGCWER